MRPQKGSREQGPCSRAPFPVVPDRFSIKKWPTGTSAGANPFSGSTMPSCNYALQAWIMIKIWKIKEIPLLRVDFLHILQVYIGLGLHLTDISGITFRNWTHDLWTDIPQHYHLRYTDGWCKGSLRCLFLIAVCAPCTPFIYYTKGDTCSLIQYHGNACYREIFSSTL